ncbi:hypothetical protein MBANPS3_006151 [Mucor bainieri]
MSTDIRYQKPDTIDTTRTQRSIAPVSTVYEKPNAYDEGPPKVITASRHGSRSSRMTVDSFASRYFQRHHNGNGTTTCQSPALSSASTNSTMTTTTTTDLETVYSPNTPLGSPPSSPKKLAKKPYTSQITTAILSQSTPTTQTTFAAHQDELLKDAPAYVMPSSPANSITGIDTDTITAETHQRNNRSSNAHAANIVAAAAAALLSNDSGIQSKNRATTTNNNKTKNNVIVYNFKKASILKPNQHHIYLHIDHEDEQDDEEVMVYRKIQPYASWGLQSMLYCNQNDGQGIKVAEARRGAFQRHIAIESADYHNSLIDDITQSHIPTLRAPATHTVYCQDLVKRSQSNILFEYETWFHGSCMRWKRPSLLSHDFTCEIKLTRQETKQQQQQQLLQQKISPSKKKSRRHTKSTKDDGFIDSDSDNDEDDHDNHSHKTCRRWKLIAEFHSHKLSYLSKSLGRLSIDLDILNQVEKDRCDLLEANIVMTTCTLIDLIRDIMGK